jgi:hypothetical protein
MHNKRVFELNGDPCVSCFVFSFSDELEKVDENDEENEEENEEELSHFNGDIIFDGDPAGALGVSGLASPAPVCSDMSNDVLCSFRPDYCNENGILIESYHF